jgi:hypothetical protein
VADWKKGATTSTTAAHISGGADLEWPRDSIAILEPRTIHLNYQCTEVHDSALLKNVEIIAKRLTNASVI